MKPLAIDRDELRAALGDGYEPLELLGQGTYGAVFRATQTRTGQVVAIKVQRLSADLSLEQRAARVARFERETRLCATLNHPNIVRIIDTGRADDGLYMVFELVPGETLTELLARRRALPPAEAVELLGQVLEALETAHGQGIVHRDLKPENIMVVTGGGLPYVKVLDFGIGAYVTDAGAGLPTLTRSHEFVGTPSYSAPEQLRGEPATPRSDIYAWGLVLLECLTGRRLMDGATVAQVFYKQLSPEEVPLPASVVMHPLGALLRRALAKQSRERASSAGRLARELRELRVSDLVGPLAQPETAPPARTVALEGVAFGGERRQATVVSCSLAVVPACPNPPDLETFDAIARDQLNTCVDIATRFGGHVVGRLANRIVALFGFPQASDSDARRACRAALELSSRIHARRSILAAQQGVDLELRIGIHTGMVLVASDGTPGGPAFSAATRLEGMAPVGATLASAATRGLLRRQLGFRPFEAAGEAGPGADQPAYLLVSEGPSGGGDPGLERGPGPPLVGRDQELETLLEHWEKARGGAGRTVLLRGEAGVGKSRLVQEIRQRALAEDASCYECRCFPEEINNALDPVLGFLRQQLELAGVKPEAQAAALEAALAACGLEPARSMPVVASWLSLPTGHPPLPLSGERQREVLLDALVRLFGVTRSGEPRLIVVEDLHWSDPTTRQFVSRLAELATGQAVLMLLTARPELEQAPEGAHPLELAGLDRASVERLIEASAGPLALDRAVVEGIVARTDGIPLFVEELTRSLLGSGRGEIPASLLDLLNSRLDRLGPAKETAQVAAALGREFELDLLDVASTRGSEALKAHLEVLVEANMLRQRLQASGARYQFRHALIQEAAWQSMLSGQRRTVHGRIAQALEDRAGQGGGRDAARLARHHELAGAIARAVGYRLQAGTEAAQASASQEALAHLRAGLALLEQVPPGPRASLEIDLLNALGGVLIATRGLAAPEVVETYTRSWELVRGGGPSPIQGFRTLRGLWTFHNARADYPSAGEIVERMLDLAAREQGSEFQLAAHECAGQTALLTGRFQATVQHSQACARYFDPALQREQIVRYASDLRLNALSFGCIAQALLGQVDRTREGLVIVLEESERLGLPGLRALMLGQAAWIDLLWSGCLLRSNPARAQAQARAQEVVRLADEVGFQFGQAYGRLLASAAGALDGQAEAVAGLEQLTHLWRLSGTSALLSWQLAFLAQGKLALGDHAGARAAADAAVEHCERTGEAYGASEAQRVLGLVLSAPGNPARDPGRAAQAFGRALEIAERQEARWLTLRAAFSFAGAASPELAGPARDRLAEELGWFREQRQGLETPLVADCRELLA